MNILCVITARGGSKGLPGKNIKLLAGKPLIAYTIEAAKEAGVFDRIILSTDDETIAAVGREYGAEVPFMRPAELAQDTTPTLPVLIHALSWLKENESYVPDAVCLLQPTAPLRTALHIQEAHALLEQTRADSVISVCEVPTHYNPHWQFSVDTEGRAALVTGESVADIIKRRQDLPPTYARNGAIYLFKTELLHAAQPSFYGNDVCAYRMSAADSVNIDTLEEFERVEQYLQQKT